MKVLIVGSGGREHALAWKVAQSKLTDKVFCAPGNAGIARQAECVEIKADDIPGLLTFARKEKIDLTVVGPEVALSLGIVDEFKAHKLRIFGPDASGARLESSKVFAKELMAKYKVPTADFQIFEDAGLARKYIQKIGAPCVIKADGLAQGKGVVVGKSIEEAEVAVSSIMEKKIFGKAGSRVIIEECLEGEEASILVLTDSRAVLPLASSQDHKRVFDGDAGPNTGGMGAYSPAPIVSEELFKQVMEKVIYRAMDGLAKEGIEYKGVLYAGIMVTKEGPKCLEFNARFGDPETQVILPRLKSDLLEVMLAASVGKLSRYKNLQWEKRASVCVVCASKGYPGEYEKGKEIAGLEEAGVMKDIFVFHSGTSSLPAKDSSRIVTNGGRVLGVTGSGDTLKEAITKTYQAVGKIHFEGMHYRKDIGARAIK